MNRSVKQGGLGRRLTAIGGLTFAALLISGAGTAFANGTHSINWSGSSYGSSTISWNGTKNFHHQTNLHSYGKNLYAGAQPFRDNAPDPSGVKHLTSDTTFDANSSGNINGTLGEIAWSGIRIATYENKSFAPDPHGPEATDRR